MVDSGRYWMMALGEESRHWDSCRETGVAFIGWDNVGDLRQYQNKDQLSEFGLGMNDALACWEFCHVMKPGDTIFVKKGARLVLGHGVVRSEYRFDEARPEYRHVRDIEWLSNTDGVKIREKELVRKTLTDITDYPEQVADAKRALNIPQYGKSQGWSEFLHRVKRCRADPDFEANEVTYKLEVAAKVNAARERLLSGEAGWEDLLRHAFTHKINNLTNFQQHDTFLKWMDRYPGRCRDALLAIWEAEGSPEERLQDFCDQVPDEVLGTLGGPLNIGTFLLMAEDVYGLPPAKINAFRKAWKLAGRGNGPTGGPAAVYGEILRFLDDLVHESRDWGIPLRDRLEAQGCVWSATRPERHDPDTRPQLYDLTQACQELFLPADEIEGLVRLLKRKKNFVLQGPPGTGKTYVAQRLAWLLTGEQSKDHIVTVQFHQSYGYEDFVRGYRPTATGGFDLQDGPFLRLCARAREAPDRPYVLIIDEINRGNLSRIFGELLMLIEADKRDPAWAVHTAYGRSNEPPFHVPANLHLIGAMNTADRSLALVDYALRRRFAFSTIQPAFGSKGFDNHLTVGGVPERLRRRISTRLEALNRQIREHSQLGEGFQIGHSYFCRPPEGSVDAAGWNDWYRDVVLYEIEPLLQEYWFDDAELARNAATALLAAD